MEKRKKLAAKNWEQSDPNGSKTANQIASCEYKDSVWLP